MFSLIKHSHLTELEALINSTLIKFVFWVLDVQKELVGVENREPVCLVPLLPIVEETLPIVFTFISALLI